MKYEYIIDTRGAYVVPWADTPEIKNQRDKYFSNKFGVRQSVWQSTLDCLAGLVGTFVE